MKNLFSWSGSPSSGATGATAEGMAYRAQGFQSFLTEYVISLMSKVPSPPVSAASGGRGPRRASTQLRSVCTAMHCDALRCTVCSAGSSLQRCLLFAPSCPQLCFFRALPASVAQMGGLFLESKATIEGAATALRAQSQTASRPPQATGRGTEDGVRASGVDLRGDSERCSGPAGL